MRFLSLLFSLSLIPGAVYAQSMTIQAVPDDADLRVTPGQTVRIDIVADWNPSELGIAAVFFDIINVEGVDAGVFNFSEAQGLGRNPILRVPSQGEGQIADADGDQDNDIVGIEVAQQGPVFNMNFTGANPITLFSFDWTAPTTSPTGFPVSLRIDVEPPFPTVYVDSFNAVSFNAVTPTVTFDVLPPPDPRDLNDDERTDQLDLGVLLAAFGTTAGVIRYNPRADLDSNGVVDFADLSFLSDVLDPTCPADVQDVPPTANVSIVPVDNTGVTLGQDPSEPDFNGGVTQHTFDLIVDVSGTADWTSASVVASSTAAPGATFFEHTRQSGAGFPPLPAGSSLSPALKFDSYWCGASTLDAGSIGAFPGFVGSVILDPTMRCATWFDLANTGAGSLTIARFTVSSVAPLSGIIGSVQGTITERDFSSIAGGFTLDITLPDLCSADFNNDGAVSILDLLEFLDLWLVDDPATETDGNPGIDIRDLLTFLDGWLTGC